MFYKLFRAPVVLALAAPDPVRVGEVEPHDIDPAKAGQELAGLAVQVLAVAGDVAVSVGLDVLFVVAPGVQPVDRELRMVPVY